MLANAIYLSKLIYLIQLSGSAQDILMKALQVSQNKCMRAVTGMSWFTPTNILLKKCSWLSVRQLAVYHTLLSTHKIIITENPEYHHKKMSAGHSHNTRNIAKFSDNFGARSDMAKRSFCYRGVVEYNKLPYEIKMCRNPETFKIKLKHWVRANVIAQ